MSQQDDLNQPAPELQRLRNEHRQVSDVLVLIQQLTGNTIRSESTAELFDAAFRTLFACVPFDIAVAVMLEQNLDLYVSTRDRQHSSVGDHLVRSIRDQLSKLLKVSFEQTDVIVKSERNELPGHGGDGDVLAHSTYAILELERRTAGLLLLYRAEPQFEEEQREILEIFSAQISMLLGNLQARERILALADSDDLTGIANKRAFRRQLPQEVDRARVYNIPLSVLIFDVDDFKQINDGFGHTVGDVVLSELCGAVCEILRPPDLFARFGGDEFSVILPHTDLPGACAVAERILTRVAELVVPTDDEAGIRCSVSIGVAVLLQSDKTGEEVVRRADDRLYLSKRQGKNRYTS